MPRMTWTDRVVLITGAASGIGEATAEAVVKRGARVILIDRDPRVTDVAKHLSSDGALGLAGDVADPGSIGTCVEQGVERFGRIDVAFANAGVAPKAPTTVLTTADGVYDHVVGVDLTGVWHTVRATLPHIVESRGYVLLSGSVYSFLNGVVNAPYAMSKAAVQSLGRTLRVELAPHGASAGVLYPGWIDTPIVAPAFGAEPLVTSLREAGYPGPLGRLISPNRVANAVVRAIEHRSARTVVPKRWLPVALGHSVANPVIDWSLTVRPGFRRQVQEIEAQHGRAARR